MCSFYPKSETRLKGVTETRAMPLVPHRILWWLALCNILGFTLLVLQAEANDSDTQWLYCSQTEKTLSDQEYILLAIKLKEQGIARHGGMNAYETELIKKNETPSRAGRDFNMARNNCCRVYRGDTETKQHCGWLGYPVCVVLNNITSKDQDPVIGDGDLGEAYYFDECGNPQNPN